MEIILLIIFVAAGVFGVVDGAGNDWNMSKRALRIGNAHKNAAIESKGKSFEESQEISQAQLQKLFDDALEAERAEQKILSDNWEKEFIELLPDTDPTKVAISMRKQGISVIDSEEVNFLTPSIGYTGEQLTYAERIVAKDTAYVREYPTDSCDFTATFQRGATIRVYGWMRGRFVGKTDVWYQVKTETFEGWVWSGSLNSSSTQGLARLEFPSHAKPKIYSAIEQEAIRRALAIRTPTVQRRKSF
jgi:uncharacterized protein YgiM (DUF1202 family)